MDIQALVQALTNTLDPGLREQAEALLDEVRQEGWMYASFFTVKIRL